MLVFGAFEREEKGTNIIADMVRWVGLWGEGMLKDVIRVLILNSLLFLGEIYQQICDLYGQYRHERYY